MDPTKAVEVVVGVLQKELPTFRSRALTATSPLLSTGLLDSFAIVTLLAALDAAFGIDVPVESVELEQFETPATIAQMCVAALGTRRA
jgi:acyl carrier protein